LEEFKLVAVGGTFDLLHKGHRELILTALKAGEKVLIGLTTDTLVHKLHKPHRVKGFDERRKDLFKFLEDVNASLRAEIIPLNDPYGPTVTNGNIEALVVSSETVGKASKINALRRERGYKLLKVIVVPWVTAEDGKPISTTRIRIGRIDGEGRVITPSC